MNLESFKPEAFPLRPGMDIQQTVESLAKDPEFILSPEEREEVLEYEKELTRSESLPLKSGETAKGIEHAWKMRINTSEFYEEYFLTEEGRSYLAEALGAEVPQFRSLTDIEEYFCGLDYRGIDAKVLEKISGKSRQYSEGLVVEQFANNGYASLENVENPTKLNIVRNPEVLADKLQSLRLLKQYYKEQEELFIGKEDHVSQAKLTMLTLHRRRLNELLVGEYANTAVFLKQHRTAPQERSQDIYARLEKNIRGPKLFEDERQYRASSRLDKFAQGVGERMYGGDYSPVNPGTQEIIEEIEQMIKNPEPMEDYTFKDVDPQLLREIKIGAEEFIGWAKKALREYGILSQHEEYSPDRAGRAPDGLWQIVVDPSKESLIVVSQQGVVKVPEAFNRALASTSPTGAVAVLDHEITHVIQNENKEGLGLSITENVGLDRSSVNSEAGAVLIEEETQAELFGHQRVVDVHYLRALQRRMLGGTLVECMKAFFDSVKEANPAKDDKETAKLAIDRSARQFRFGGSFSDTSPHATNTQPLVYMEQALITRALQKQNAEKLLMVGGVNIEALSKLHRIGLFNRNNIQIPERKPSQIIMPEIESKLGKSGKG
ncbi:MAG: hypothetical protein WD200_04835 [Candidatus Andersenbacteria bacterium]